MSKTFKETIRRYCSKDVYSKPQTWYLMGTANNDLKIENSGTNILRKDFIYGHRSFFAQYVKEAVDALEGDEFLVPKERFANVCHYNGLDREQYTSWVMLAAYHTTEEDGEITEDKLKRISMLAWAFEAACTSVVLTDDYMDGETSRWKKPSWCRLSNIGNTVITDGDLLRMSGFYMIRKYFRDQAYYASLLNLLNDMCFMTAVGQTMDMYASKKFKQYRDINIYNLKKYYQMGIYKSYIPIFRCCTVAALYLTNTTSEYLKYEHVFKKFGSHGQITNDLYDLYGKYENFGRNSSDIKEGKFSWVVSTATDHANDKQKLLLQKNYGRSEPECQQVVLDVYKEIDVLQKFYEYKNELLKEVRNDLKTVSNPKILSIVENYINLYIDVDYDFRPY
ncbi:hypothetical protein FQR65_LT12369 [Abscondita terminalis]|nr:hypothetical protein FQR65_LT12369 [Abscondita terminalis]